MKTLLLSACILLAATLNAQNFQWAKAFSGTSYEAGRSITVDDSGNVYTTGQFLGIVDFDPGVGTYNLTSVGGYDIFVQKMDASGNFLWAKSFGGIASDYAFSIAVDASSNVYTTGYFGGTADFDPGSGTTMLSSSGSKDIFVQKMDASGSFLWAKAFGSSASEEGYSIAVDIAGNVYTTGYFETMVDFDPGVGTANLTATGNRNIFVLKLDSSGNFVWAKTFGGFVGKSIDVDTHGNVYTTGYFYGMEDFDPGNGTTMLSSAGNTDVFVQKMDDSGNFLWAKAFGGVSSVHGESIEVDLSGNIYTTGYFVLIADFDPGVGTANLTATGIYDIFVQKIDSLGNFIWAKSFGGISVDYASSIAVDNAGNVYSTGSFEGTVDFDPGAGTTMLTSAGGRDIFIQKIDPSGNFIWAKAFGEFNIDQGWSIAVDASGNIYTTGNFKGTVDFDPGPGTANLTSVGNSDIFVHKMGQTTVGFNEKSFEVKTGIYPNPNQGAFTIDLGKNHKDLKIRISDITGKLIKSYEYEKAQLLNLDFDAPAGIYFLSLESETERAVIRLVKQ